MSVTWNTVSRAWLVAALFMTAAGLQSANGQEADGGGDLVGDWALNRALSDNPAEQLSSVRGGAPPPAGMSRSGRTPNPSGFDAVRRAAERFRIERTDSTVVVAYPDHERVLSTDGRKQKLEVGEGREVEFRTRWDGGRLFIERKLDGGVAMTEEYWVQAGTGRLHVLTRLVGDRLPSTIAFMRVYERVTAAADN
jgi:hypothetical protein